MKKVCSGREALLPSWQKKKMVAVVAAVCIHCQSFKLKQVGGQGRMGGGPGGGHPEGGESKY